MDFFNNPTPQDIERAAIELLHFHPKWFIYRLLPREFYAHQVQRFGTATAHQAQEETFSEAFSSATTPGRDSDLCWVSPEHHRYLAFSTVLSSHQQFTDEQIENYVELCQLDEDQFMAEAALIGLIRFMNLTADQRQYLLSNPACQTPRVQGFVQELRDSPT